MSTGVGEEGGEQEPNDDTEEGNAREWVSDPELRCGVSMYGDPEE